MDKKEDAGGDERVIREPGRILNVEKHIQGKEKEQGIREETWAEFLGDCNVDHWAWTYWGEAGEIIEADPTDDPDFRITGESTVNWGGGDVYITDGIGTGFVILTEGRSNELVPLDGRIFATREEAKEYQKEWGGIDESRKYEKRR